MRETGHRFRNWLGNTLISFSIASIDLLARHLEDRLDRALRIEAKPAKCVAFNALQELLRSPLFGRRAGHVPPFIVEAANHRRQLCPEVYGVSQGRSGRERHAESC